MLIQSNPIYPELIRSCINLLWYVLCSKLEFNDTDVTSFTDPNNGMEVYIVLSAHLLGTTNYVC